MESLTVEGENEFRELRGVVLDDVAYVEAVLDAALSLLLGRGERQQDALYKDVLWRVPLENRIALLLRLLDEIDLAERFPFLELATSAVNMRNSLAHMVLDVYESTDDELVLLGRRRGDDKTQRVKVEDLRRAGSVLYHVGIDLQLLRRHLTAMYGQPAPTPAPEE